MLDTTVVRELLHRTPPELLGVVEPSQWEVDPLDLAILDLERALRRVRWRSGRLPCWAPPAYLVH